MKKKYLVLIGLTTILTLGSYNFLHKYLSNIRPNTEITINTNEKNQLTKSNNAIDITANLIEPTKNVDSSNSTYIKISAVGDILVHDAQLKAQYNSETKKYNFINNFKYVKPLLENSDIAIANLETSLGSGIRPFSGYPIFNTPDEMITALKDTGFTILSAANNHILDCGSNGLVRTARIVKENNLDLIGIKEKKEDNSYVIKEIKGFKIGFSNYVFETPKKNNNKTINSIPVPIDVLPLLDTFNYENLDSDLVKMKARVSEMKTKGAEFIIFSMHWGNEYERMPNSYQKKIATALSNFGVDLIIGGHPHVLQPIEYVKSNVSNKNTLVLYSLGNFISNQCYEELQKREPEDGIIVNITLKADISLKDISISNVDYIPTWVHRQETKPYNTYEIVPLNLASQNFINYNILDDSTKWRAKNSLEATTSLIGNNESVAVISRK